MTNLLDLSRIEAGTCARDAMCTSSTTGSPGHREHPPPLGRRTLAVGLGATRRGRSRLLDEAFADVLDERLERHAHQDLPAVSAGETADGRVRVTVEDDGPGVADGFGHELFDEFYRAPAPRGSRGGAEIGLAVAGGLIEATGGPVDARRSGLRGLAIDLDLPMASMPEEAPRRST